MTTDDRTLTLAHWGAYLVRSGRGATVDAVTPWPGDPDPSPIGARMGRTTGARVDRPLVRASWLEHGVFAAPDLRGDEELHAVSWDVALDLVAEALRSTIAQTGNESIFGGSYGWGSAGRFHHPQSQLKRFLSCLGGYTGSDGTYSHGAAEVVAPAVLGLDLSSFLRTAPRLDEIAADTQLVVSLGGFPAPNTQITSGGAAEHRYRPSLRQAAARGCRFIAIAPNRHDFEDELDAEWIPIRPGTDAALLLGIAGELVAAGRWDRDFVATRCSDPTRLLDHLRGTSDGTVRDAAWASRICGIPPERIRRLTDELLKGRTVLNATWSTQRVADGEHAVWALIVVGALAGLLHGRGRGLAFGLGSMGSVGQSEEAARLPSLPQGDNPITTSIPVTRLSDALLQPGAPYTFGGERRRYPSIELVYWCGGNPFHHHQDLHRLDRAWRRPSAVIVHDPFLTATAQRADIVLPATTAWERDDIGGSSTGTHLVAMQAATQPHGQARHDHDIFADLAGRLGVRAAFTADRSVEQWLQRLYAEMRQQDPSLPAYEEFRERGVVRRTTAVGVTPWEQFLDDPERNPLATSSGRIQLSLPAAPGVPGLPDHTGPPASDLLLVSPMPTDKLHSQLAGDETGPATVLVHPQDAEVAAVADGDPVVVENERGAVAAVARVTSRVSQGVLLMENGAWLDLDPATGQCRRGNPNLLTTDTATSAWGQACAAHGCSVHLRRSNVAATR